eukprot:tig00001027_g6397.t1
MGPLTDYIRISRTRGSCRSSHRYQGVQKFIQVERRRSAAARCARRRSGPGAGAQTSASRTASQSSHRYQGVHEPIQVERRRSAAARCARRRSGPGAGTQKSMARDDGFTIARVVLYLQPASNSMRSLASSAFGVARVAGDRHFRALSGRVHRGACGAPRMIPLESRVGRTSCSRAHSRSPCVAFGTCFTYSAGYQLAEVRSASGTADAGAQFQIQAGGLFGSQRANRDCFLANRDCILLQSASPQREEAARADDCRERCALLAPSQQAPSFSDFETFSYLVWPRSLHRVSIFASPSLAPRHPLSALIGQRADFDVGRCQFICWSRHGAIHSPSSPPSSNLPCLRSIPACLSSHRPKFRNQAPAVFLNSGLRVRSESSDRQLWMIRRSRLPRHPLKNSRRALRQRGEASTATTPGADGTPVLPWPFPERTTLEEHAHASCKRGGVGRDWTGMDSGAATPRRRKRSHAQKRRSSGTGLDWAEERDWAEDPELAIDQLAAAIFQDIRLGGRTSAGLDWTTEWTAPAPHFNSEKGTRFLALSPASWPPASVRLARILCPFSTRQRRHGNRAAVGQAACRSKVPGVCRLMIMVLGEVAHR